MKARRWWILGLCMLAGSTLVLGTSFSWSFSATPSVYFHAYRSASIFHNIDDVGQPDGDLICLVRFYASDPSYIVKHPLTSVVEAGVWYPSTSYIGLTRVSGSGDLTVRFDWKLSWTGSEQTSDWAGQPPDCRETVQASSSTQSTVSSDIGAFTVATGDRRRVLSVPAGKANDPHILVIRTTEWGQLDLVFPEGTNPEVTLRVHGKSTLIVVFYPNRHNNQIVFRWDAPEAAVPRLGFEYIVKRIPVINP